MSGERINNDNSNNNDAYLANPKSHLDRLLVGKDPEVQNKVLRFALDSGMRENDPAFRLVQYIGYLATLTELAPEQWKALFEEFEEVLSAWSQHHLEQLDSLKAQTTAIKELAQSCNNLGKLCNASTQTLEKFMKQFEDLTPLLLPLTNVQADLQELQLLKNSPPPSLSPAQQQQIKTLVTEAVRQELKNFLNSQLIKEETGEKLKLAEVVDLIYRKVEALRKKLLAFQNQTILGLNFDAKSTWQYCIPMFAMGIVLIVALVGVAVRTFTPGLPVNTAAQIEETWQRSGWNMVKLEKIEKKLGIHSSPKVTSIKP